MTFLLIQIGVVLAGFPLAWHIIGESARAEASFRTGLAADHVRSLIHAVNVELERVADEAQQSSPRSPADFRAMLAGRDVFDRLVRRQQKIPVVDVIGIFAIDGAVINFTRQFPPMPINIADRDYFRAHFAGDGLALQISTPVRARGSGAWTFYLSRAIRSSTGGIVGLVVAGINVTRLAAELHGFDSGAVQSMSLVRTDGVLLGRAQPETTAPGPATAPSPLPGTRVPDLASVHGGLLESGIFSRHFVSTTPIADLPLRIEAVDRVSLWPTDPTLRSLWLVVGLGPLVMLLATLFVGWFSRRRQLPVGAGDGPAIGFDADVPTPMTAPPVVAEQAGTA